MPNLNEAVSDVNSSDTDDFWGNSTDDDFGGNTSGDDFWSDSDTTESGSSDDFWSNTSDNDDSSTIEDNKITNTGGSNPEPSDEDMFSETVDKVEIPQIKKKEFSYKSVAVILAGAFIVVAILLTVFDNISISKNTKNKDSQEQVGQTQEGGTSQTSSISLVDVPADTSVNYNSNVETQTVKVQNKVRYLQDGQLIHCIDLALNIGGTTKIVHYYCGYNVYNSVSIGESVNVEYQYVSETVISVVTISK